LLYATPAVTCPLCRKKTDLPPGGVRRLPDNFLVPRLVDIVCGPTKPHSVPRGTADTPTRVIPPMSFYFEIAKNNKSAFSAVRRLSIWHCPHLLLSAVLRRRCC